jgi:hypothetical protein
LPVASGNSSRPLYLSRQTVFSNFIRLIARPQSFKSYSLVKLYSGIVPKMQFWDVLLNIYMDFSGVDKRAPVVP